MCTYEPGDLYTYEPGDLCIYEPGDLCTSGYIWCFQVDVMCDIVYPLCYVWLPATFRS